MVASKIDQIFIKFALQETGNTCDCFKIARAVLKRNSHPAPREGVFKSLRVGVRVRLREATSLANCVLPGSCELLGTCEGGATNPLLQNFLYVFQTLLHGSESLVVHALLLFVLPLKDISGEASIAFL